MVAQSGFKSAIYTLTLFGTAVPCYAAVAALAVNLALAAGLSVVLNAVAKAPLRDTTVAEDYA
jgi:SSS family solute:Na+ symporter